MHIYWPSLAPQYKSPNQPLVHMFPLLGTSSRNLGKIEPGSFHYVGTVTEGSRQLFLIDTVTCPDTGPNARVCLFPKPDALAVASSAHSHLWYQLCSSYCALLYDGSR